MVGLPLYRGSFHPINLVLYISIFYTNYETKKRKKIKNKIIVDNFFFSLTKIVFPSEDFQIRQCSRDIVLKFMQFFLICKKYLTKIIKVMTSNKNDIRHKTINPTG